MFWVPKGKEAKLLKPLRFILGQPPEELQLEPSLAWLLLAPYSFRSYQEVGGSPPVQSVAPLVEVLTLLKWKKRSSQKVQKLKN